MSPIAKAGIVFNVSICPCECVNKPKSDYGDSLVLWTIALVVVISWRGLVNKISLAIVGNAASWLVRSHRSWFHV